MLVKMFILCDGIFYL